MNKEVKLGSIKRPTYIIGMSSVMTCNEEARRTLQFARRAAFESLTDLLTVYVHFAVTAPLIHMAVPRAQMMAEGADAGFIKWEMPNWSGWEKSWPR